MSQQGLIEAVVGAKSVVANEEVVDHTGIKYGELVVEDTGRGDVEGTFMGDGLTTTAQISGRVIDLNTSHDPVLDSFQGSQIAALFGAEMTLRLNPKNGHLLAAGVTAESPLPEGLLLTVSQNDLKRALAPFKGKLEQLRTAVANMNSTNGLTRAESRVLGRATTPAMGLPTDIGV